jgi:hypothetical protein
MIKKAKENEYDLSWAIGETPQEYIIKNHDQNMNLLGEKTDMIMKELVIDYSKNTKVNIIDLQKPLV